LRDNIVAMVGVFSQHRERDQGPNRRLKIRAYEDASRWGAPRESLPAENRDNTIACGRHGAGVPISLTIGRMI
jgi:hypothetical protein